MSARESLTTWRDALAARLNAGALGVPAYAAQPDRLSPPCVFIEPDVPYVEWDETTTETEARVNYRLMVVANPIGTIEQRLTQLEIVVSRLILAMSVDFDQWRELGTLRLGESTYVAAALAGHTYITRKA